MNRGWNKGKRKSAFFFIPELNPGPSTSLEALPLDIEETKKKKRLIRDINICVALGLQCLLFPKK
jgi:hypothetical protein